MASGLPEVYEPPYTLAIQSDLEQSPNLERRTRQNRDSYMPSHYQDMSKLHAKWRKRLLTFLRELHMSRHPVQQIGVVLEWERLAYVDVCCIHLRRAEALSSA